MDSAAVDGRALALRRLALLELAVLVAINLVVFAVPAGLHWDFANYYDAGRKALLGETGNLFNEWALIGGVPPQGHMAFLSAPITSYLYAPMAMLPPEWALVLFKVQGFAATALALFLVWRRVRPMAGETDAQQAAFAVLFVAMAGLFQPLWTIYVTGGQVTPWLFLLLVVGWLAHERGRFWISAACFVAAVAAKPFLVAGFVFLALISGRRYVVAAAILGAAAAAASIALVGWPSHQLFLVKLAENGGLLKANVYNSGLTAWIDAALIPFPQMQPGLPRPAGVVAIEMALRLGLTGLFFFAAWSARSWREAPRRNLHFMLAMVLPVLVTPIAWDHYLTFLFPLAAWMAADRARAPPAARIGLMVFMILCVGRNFVVFTTLARVIGADTQAKLVAVAVFNSAPLTLLVGLLLAFHRSLLASFQRSDGPRAAGPPATAGRPATPRHANQSVSADSPALPKPLGR